jgi:hypothetical protein
MRESETWFQKNNLRIYVNTENICYVISKQMRVPLRLQITFKNMKISCQSSKAMQSSLYDENIKRNIEPLYDKKHYYLDFQSCLRYGIALWGGYNESDNIFIY